MNNQTQVSLKRRYDEMMDTDDAADARPHKTSRTHERPLILGKRSSDSLDTGCRIADSRPVKRSCFEEDVGYPTSFAYERINRVLKSIHMSRLAELGYNTPPRAAEALADTMEVTAF